MKSERLEVFLVTGSFIFFSVLFTQRYLPDVATTGAEVKRGQTVSLTCRVSNSQPAGVTVSWRDDPGTALLSYDNGVLVSVLVLNNVLADSNNFCLTRSKTFTESELSETAALLEIYGNANFFLKPNSWFKYFTFLSCNISI